MDTIGPQRATPSSPAKIAAEVVSAKRILGACEAAQRLRLYWDVEVIADYGVDDGTDPDVAASQYHDDVQAVVDAFYARMRVDERKNDPPTREMLLRLGAIAAPPCGELVLHGIFWLSSAVYPMTYVGMREVELNTIEKLRAALFLAGHCHEEVL